MNRWLDRWLTLLLLALIVNLSARLVTAVLPEQDLERK